MHNRLSICKENPQNDVKFKDNVVMTIHHVWHTDHIQTMPFPLHLLLGGKNPHPASNPKLS